MQKNERNRRGVYASWIVNCLTLWVANLPISPAIHFTDVTPESGILFKHEDGRSGKKYYLETLGSGAAWFDYDRDGDLDIYFVNGTALPGTSTVGKNALYHNNGDGTFTDITLEASIGDQGYGFSCAIGDYDNDGFFRYLRGELRSKCFVP